MDAAAISADDTYASSQWALDAVVGTSGINLDGAIGLGLTELAIPTVAVIDTGWTSHPDGVVPVAEYDFVTDTWSANDGDGRDSNATDPGDWCLSDDDPTSSWHGTSVAGVISAVRNNGTGIAGILSNVNMVHARVLGKCGGEDADIADAIRWAAGGEVDGVPTIGTRADVINLSLGGRGRCNSYLQEAITFAIQSDVLVVVAAGNSSQNAAEYSPANCQGVLAVGAATKAGRRTTYSNYGSTVGISAPGGENTNCSTGVCLDAVYTLSNTGSTTIGTASYTAVAGTSIAAPQVAAVGAWLASVSERSAGDIKALLKASATAFPAGSGCSGTQTCGSGLLNAYGALAQLNSLSNVPAAPATRSKSTTKTITKTGRSNSGVDTYGGDYSYSGSSIVLTSGYGCDYCHAVAYWDLSVGNAGYVNLKVKIYGHKLYGYEDDNPAGIYYYNEDGDSKIDGPMLRQVGSYDTYWTYNHGDVTQYLENGVIRYGIGAEEADTYSYFDSWNESGMVVSKVVWTITATVYSPTWSSAPSFSAVQPVVGGAYSTDGGDWGAGTSLKYQWLSCSTTAVKSCAKISGATRASYTPKAADKGKRLRVTITGKNSVGSATWTSAVTPAVAQAPSLSVTPSVPLGGLLVGVPAVGSAGTAVGTPAPSVTPQWYRCDSAGSTSVATVPVDCESIGGASTVSYIPTSDDVGKYLRLGVVATNTAGSVVSLSKTTQEVRSMPVAGTAPTLSGPDGGVYTATAGTWSGYPADISTTYAWLRCDSDGVAASAKPANCAVIADATEGTYTPTNQDTSFWLRVMVKATNTAGSTYWVSGTGPQIVGAPGTANGPGLTVQSSVGSVLQGIAATWHTVSSISPAVISWYRCTDTGTDSFVMEIPPECTVIDGVITEAYTITADDLGYYLRYGETSTNLEGTSVALSRPTTEITSGPYARVAPSVTGTHKVGKTLTATTGTWSNASGVKYSYAWYSCTEPGVKNERPGAACKLIAGQKTKTLVLTKALSGNYIRLRLTVTPPASAAGGAEIFFSVGKRVAP
jgi:serine protease